ncbi:hypothetical protein [Sandaracinus amylolyticus]|uniref:hypothetical protein n=1 Tax=Sandaracinus amylolyticus TaxID=927083 RepID=UPI001F355786|nr:hypothetical protein [Sandaracinus amylolyticus]UJR82561.1 Hypothetical protein I5071_46260 [Sandaracinus amylolyticus]
MTRRFVLALCALLVIPTFALAQDVVIPEHNRAELTEAPPRPGPGDIDERARRLIQAIAQDQPALAHDFFLSREAFRAIKGIADPDGLYDRIFRMYEDDIHELHAQLGADASRAEFVRFELSRRRAWVRLREESNRLPYWAQRHNWLVYRVGDEERRIEVRTMIAWDDRWYITHLSEFR